MDIWVIECVADVYEYHNHLGGGFCAGVWPILRNVPNLLTDGGEDDVHSGLLFAPYGHLHGDAVGQGEAGPHQHVMAPPEHTFKTRFTQSFTHHQPGSMV